MKPYHGAWIPDCIPEKWNDDVSQTEYDQFCEAHNIPWKDVTLATPHELTSLRAERCE